MGRSWRQPRSGGDPSVDDAGSAWDGAAVPLSPREAPPGGEARGPLRPPLPPNRRQRAASTRGAAAVARAEPVSRRQAAVAIGAALAAATLNARPAAAGLFDGGKAAQEKYVKDTLALIDESQAVLAVPLDDDALEGLLALLSALSGASPDALLD